MRIFIIAMLLLAVLVPATPAEAGRRRSRQAGYYDEDGNYRTYSSRSSSQYRRDRARGDRRVRSHRRRRNVLLGVGGLGLLTGSGTLTGVGLGGAAANHFIDDENRDY